MYSLAWKRCAPRLMMALVATAALLTALGCGNGITIVPTKGGFSKASLNGSYAFTAKGYGFNAGSNTAANFFVEGGVFTADGNGNITAGTDDFVEALLNTTQAFQPSAITGGYSINSDGTGDLQFNFAAGGSEVFRITLANNNDLYMEEEDGFGTSAGSAHLQASTTMPSGTFVFRTHDIQKSATMGAMTISAGAVTGSYLMVQSGVPATGSISAGSMTVPTGGRGAINYTVSGVPHSGQYYVVSASNFLLLDQTTGILSLGMAEQQSNTTFSAASLTGSYAFGGSGETTTPGFVNTVGVFATDGVSQVTAANFDSVQDGSVSSNQTPSGTYLIDNAVGKGSGSVTLGGLTRDIWMVSSSRAYFIALNGTNVEDGTIDQQTGTFTNTSLGAQAAFFMDGFDATGVDVLFKDRVGTLVPSATNTLGINYVVSVFDPVALAGNETPNSFSGTYTVASNGRTTATLNGFTNNLVLYLTSSSGGYVLQADPGVNMSGTFTVQPATP